VNLRTPPQTVKFGDSGRDIAFAPHIQQNTVFKATDRTDEHEDD
jgi:hypothetical protein